MITISLFWTSKKTVNNLKVLDLMIINMVILLKFKFYRNTD